MREALKNAKVSYIFSTNNNGVFEILKLEILTKTLTNDVVSFEQLGHGMHRSRLTLRYRRTHVK